MQAWDQKQAIYQQLADILAAQLLDGEPDEGAAMPSVRVLAGRHMLNPLTVNRALQALADQGLLEAGAGWACTSPTAPANGCAPSSGNVFFKPNGPGCASVCAAWTSAPNN